MNASLVMDITRKFVNECNVFESANAVLKQIELHSTNLQGDRDIRLVSSSPIELHDTLHMLKREHLSWIGNSLHIDCYFLLNLMFSTYTVFLVCGGIAVVLYPANIQAQPELQT